MENLADDINSGCIYEHVKYVIKSSSTTTSKLRSRSTSQSNTQRLEEVQQFTLKAVRAAIVRGSARILKVVLSSSSLQDILCKEIPALIYYATCETDEAALKDVIAELLSSLPTGNSPKSLRQLGKDGFSALHLAAIDGKVWSAKLLMQLGADAKQRSLDGNTALTFAIACNKRTFWEFVLPYSDVNSKDQDGDTPILFAAWQRESSLVRSLINENVNVNATSYHGSTALWNAVYRAAPEVVLNLLRANADMSVRCEGTHLFLDSSEDDEEQEQKVRKIYPGTPRSLLWVAVDNAGNFNTRQDSLTVLGLLLENGYDVRQETWIQGIDNETVKGGPISGVDQNIPSGALHDTDMRKLLSFLFRSPPYLRDICRNRLRRLHREYHSSIPFPKWVLQLGLRGRLAKFLAYNYMCL